MRLNLSSLELLVAGPSSPALSASLAVRDDQDAPTGLPDFAMGFGTPVPPHVKDVFEELGAIGDSDPLEIEDGGTWMHTDTTRTDQRWFVQWREDVALVCGEASAGEVHADGLTLRDSRFRLVARTQDTGPGLVRIGLQGQAAFSSDIGPLKVRDLSGRFTMDVDADHVPDLEAVLENPATLLDAALTGRLEVRINTRRVALLSAVELRDAGMTLSARISCVRGERRLRLDDALLEIGGRLLFAGAELAQSRLEARIEKWPVPGAAIELNGHGTLTLPAAVSAAVGGAGMSASVHLQCSATSTRFECGVSGLQLNPAVNILALSGAGLTTTFLHEAAGNKWRWAVEGTIEQSWARLADKARGFIDLGGDGPAADIRATMSVAAQSLPGAGQAPLRVELDLELLQHGEPYDGPWGGLPIRLSAPRLSVGADLTAAGFTRYAAEGAGRITVTDELASVLPWRNLALDAELIGGTGSRPPALRLRMTGMPPFVLPPLQRGGATIPLLKIDRAEVELGQRFRFGGAVSVLPGVTPAEMVARLGLPRELSGFLDPIMRVLVGLKGAWNVAYDTSNNSGEIEIMFEASDAPEFDPFAILRSLVPDAAVNPGSFGLPDNFVLLGVRPGAVRFRLAFGQVGGPLVQLEASVFCTVLNEQFDARLALRLNGTTPELELVAGVEDPISVRFPGLEALAGNTAQMLLTELSRHYTLSSADRARMNEFINQVMSFFEQPGLDSAAEFELRQLRLIVRPTDPAAPVEISGVMRPVRLPPFVGNVFPITPSIVLGATAGSVFFELRVEENPSQRPTPLVSVPLGDKSKVDFVLRGFKVAYAWDANSLDLGLDAGIDLTNAQLFDPAIGTGVKLPQQQTRPPGASRSVATAFTLRTIASVPPIPVPEWNVTFGDLGNPNNLGIELIVGLPRQRLLTLNLRKTAFSVTRTPFGPGGDFDGGFLFGNPPANENDVSEFYLSGSCRAGTVITYPPPLMPLLNPFGSVFPPPIPLGTVAGDIFFEELKLALNIPGLLYASLTLNKPMPEISLFTIIELIYLASKGFAVPVPADSALRKLYFTALRGRLRLPLPPTLFGKGSGGRPRMIDVLNLDIERNAADTIRAISEALNAAQQIMETGSRGLQLLTENPALLVRLVPPDQRRFTFDQHLIVPGLRLSLRASAFLLTPDELRAELVLYHESRGSSGKGVGRVRLAESSAPPSRPVIDREVIWTSTQQITWAQLVNPREAFNSKGAVFQKYVKSMQVAAAEIVRARTNEVVKTKLRPQLRTALGELFFRGGSPLWSELLNSSAARQRAALEKRGLDYAAPLVEKALRDAATSSNPRQAQQIQERLISDIVNAAPLFSPENVDLGEPREKIAAELAVRLVEDAPLQEVGARRFRMIPPASRQQLFRTRLGEPEHASLVRALEEIGNAAEARMCAQPATVDAGAFRKQLEQDILRTFNEQAIVRRPIDPAHLDDRFLGMKRVETVLSNTFRDRRDTKAVTDELIVNDLTRTLRLLSSIPSGPHLPPLADRVRELQGHEIRPRPDGPHARVVFEVAVPGPHVRFHVAFRQGRFVLVVADSRGSELSVTNVPSQIVGARTPAPGVAEQLTRQFAIAPKIGDRALRPEEKKARDDDPQETAPSLYQESLFGRDEYEIRKSGGRRGKLTLADLLRARNGSYVIPAGPVLATAGQIDLFNRAGSTVKLGMVGLLALPAAGGSAGIFLHGHQRVTLPLPFDYALELEGDFHVVAGDMWPAALADPDIKRNSVNFKGAGKLSRDRQRIANGSMTGHFEYPSDSAVPNFSLQLHLKIADSWEFEFIGVDLAKAWFEAEGDLNIKFEGGSLSMSFRADVSVMSQFAKFGTKTVQLPVVVCVPNPIGGLRGQPDSLCITDEEGRVEVPDPTRREWGPPQEHSARVRAELENGALRFEVTVPDNPIMNHGFEL
jgi:hypothetical protein